MRKILFLLVCCLSVTSISADEVVLCNFENYDVGKVFNMKDISSSTTESKAVVTLDPSNPNNKVLHVSNKSWNTFIELALPEGITGANLLDNYQSIVFDLYRPATDGNDYMQMAILLGGDQLYWDEGYPNQGNKEVWGERTYTFSQVTNNAEYIYVGFNNNAAEYYIDNIRLTGVSSTETGLVRWTGSVSNVWDMGITPNFTTIEDPGTPISFQRGNRVTFDDTAISSDSKVQVDGTVEATSIIFENKERDYQLVRSANAGALTGSGQLIITGGGSVTIDVENKLLQGTYLKNGSLRMGSVDGPNPFGTSLFSEGGAIYFNFSTSKYPTINTPITISEGKTLNVYTSQYSYWMSSLAGRGTLNIYAGGERSYLGNAKGAQYPDWSQFAGTVNLYPCKDIVATAGFYGLILGHGGKTFNPEEVEASIASGKVNNIFENKTLVMHDETTLACESGTRGFRIGELQMAPTSRICGYYKDSTPKSYFLVGCSNTDGLLAGQIAPADKNGKPYVEQTVGIVKEGTGTYTLTNNNNLITGGIRVLNGKILINNDVEAARAANLTGGTGYVKEGTQIFVFEKASIGGTGNIGGDLDVYGKLEPGNNGIGTLTLKNFAKNTPVSLYVRPTSILEFEIESADSYDRLIVDNELIYYNIMEDFTESDKKPTVRPVFLENYTYNRGDEFVLITAKGKNSLYGDPWNFDVELPETNEWKLEERTTDTDYQLVLTFDPSNGVNMTDADNDSRIYAENGVIYVNAVANEKIKIFSTSGQLIKVNIALNGLNAIPVAKGLFVVKVGEYSKKIMNY